MSAGDAVECLGHLLVAPAGLAAQLLADIGGDLPAAVERAVGQVADQGLLLAVAQPGDRQDRAGIGGDDRAEIPVDREPQRGVVL